jgi:hypothetical protein
MNETRRRTEERAWIGRHRGRVAALALAAAMTVACGGETPDPDPIGPVVERDLMCPSAQVPLCSDQGATDAARDGSSDAVTRSVAAIENAAGRASLDVSLRELESAIAAKNITKARAALAKSRTALATAGGQPADAPDLGAIELLLDYIDPLIGR